MKVFCDKVVCVPLIPSQKWMRASENHQNWRLPWWTFSLQVNVTFWPLLWNDLQFALWFTFTVIQWSQFHHFLFQHIVSCERRQSRDSSSLWGGVERISFSKVAQALFFLPLFPLPVFFFLLSLPPCIIFYYYVWRVRSNTGSRADWFYSDIDGHVWPIAAAQGSPQPPSAVAAADKCVSNRSSSRLSPVSTHLLTIASCQMC